jgi:Family of unknown function (DUF6152)
MRSSLSFKSVGRLVACSLLALSVCTSTAWAHHGGGTFDPKKCFVFKGTVRQLAWANPHTWIYVQVPKSGGSELWGYELGTVSGLARLGFRPADFPKGAPVTITANINRTAGKHTGSSKKLVLADGRVVGGALGSGSAPGAPGERAATECPEYK